MSIDEPNYKALFIQAETERDRVTRQYQRLLATSDEQLIYISELKDEIEKWKRSESVACERLKGLCDDALKIKADLTNCKSEADRLKADVEKLTFDPLSYLDDAGEWIPRDTHLNAVARLKAENERLIKAGDAMSNALWPAIPQAVYEVADWDAAKKGKDL